VTLLTNSTRGPFPECLAIGLSKQLRPHRKEQPSLDSVEFEKSEFLAKHRRRSVFHIDDDAGSQLLLLSAHVLANAALAKGKSAMVRLRGTVGAQVSPDKDAVKKKKFSIPSQTAEIVYEIRITIFE